SSEGPTQPQAAQSPATPPSPAPSRPRRLLGWAERSHVGGLATFVIAVVGCVTGLMAFQRDRSTPLRMILQPYDANDGTAVRVAIVNKSAHATSLLDGVVEKDGETLGKIKWIVPDVRLLDQPSPGNNLLLQAVHPLPYAVAPGETLVAGLFWEGRAPVE